MNDKTEHAEAVEACRQWAHIREAVLFAVDNDTASADPDKIREFDAQMFRLGEKAFRIVE
jgi:hypothetical protein